METCRTCIHMNADGHCTLSVDRLRKCIEHDLSYYEDKEYEDD